MPRPRRVLVSTLRDVRPDGDARVACAGRREPPRPTSRRRRRQPTSSWSRLTGPGATADRGGVTARAFRESALAAAGRDLGGRRRLRTRLPLDHGPQRVRRPADARPGPITWPRTPRVAMSRRDSTRRLADVATTAPPRPPPGCPGKGGAPAVVIGLVDSGLWPDSPLFADVRGLGRGQRATSAVRASQGPAGTPRSATARSWERGGSSTASVPTGCAAAAGLSPLDDDGHGTLVASVAAGNAGVSVQVPGQRSGLYAGAAPQARLAVYKACWTAPDPRDDGCSTADLVTAIDRSVADGVDVLNLSVDGPSDGRSGVDTLERAQALLGAAEADVVVVAASGNRGTQSYAAHAVPVGHLGGWHHGSDAPWGFGRLRSAARGCDGRAFGPHAPPPCSSGPERAGRRRLVVLVPLLPARQPRRRPRLRTHRRVRARPHRTRRQVRGRTRGPTAWAWCWVNTSRGQATADFHSVPTVHLTKDDGHRLVRGGCVTHPGRLVAAAPRRCAAHPRAARRLDELGRPDGRLREARRRRDGRRRPRRHPAVAPRPSLGPRLRHVGRRRPYQRR